jgi:hypothetical protein
MAIQDIVEPGARPAARQPGHDDNGGCAAMAGVSMFYPDLVMPSFQGQFRAEHYDHQVPKKKLLCLYRAS